MKKTVKALWACAFGAVLTGCAAFNVGGPETYSVDLGERGRLEVTRQKRMSFGFLPALAEEYCRPPESIKPMVGWTHSGDGRYWRDRREPVLRYVLFGWVVTPWALLVTPWHGEYSCGTHLWMNNGAEKIALLPQDAQTELGVKTSRDDSGKKWGMNGGSFTHSALLGFHRYETVVVDEKDKDEDED
jgi:hypothetical protein